MHETILTYTAIMLLCSQTVFNIRCANEAVYEDLSKKLETHGIAYKYCPINYKEPKVPP